MQLVINYCRAAPNLSQEVLWNISTGTGEYWEERSLQRYPRTHLVLAFFQFDFTTWNRPPRMLYTLAEMKVCAEDLHSFKLPVFLVPL